MRDLLLHAVTRQQLERFLAAPSHAVMLTGPAGSGKLALASALAEAVLELEADTLADHPYALQVKPEAGKAIGIEAVRVLEQFLSLKVPGSQSFDRVIIIENAHTLTTEAQNALLKTLEEPPQGTLLILTVHYPRAVLPTIRSRVQAIPINRLERSALEAHFQSRGFDAKAINQAYAITAGLPGLMHALLHEADHPLLAATVQARQLLSQSAYERLLSVDQLAKDKTLAADTIFILQQMAHVSLQTASGPAAKKWQRVLEAGYQAAEALEGSGQPKLVLTNLMIRL